MMWKRFAVVWLLQRLLQRNPHDLVEVTLPKTVRSRIEASAMRIPTDETMF